MKIARVFPRRTKATPDDNLTFTGEPDMFILNEGIDKVNISVTFTYDIPRAKELYLSWGKIAPVSIGGPAMGTKGEDFEPGKYIKKGYIITSRGCPNKCWFCSVWKREGNIINELPIKEGYNVLDDNLLACSKKHIYNVFEMLKKQKEIAQFTGGLEAKRFEIYHGELLKDLKPSQFFFAYDTPDDLEPLINAIKICKFVGIKRPQTIRCYVLIGYPKDTIEDAEKRLMYVCKLGSFPMAMLWRSEDGKTNPQWRKFGKYWCRLPSIAAFYKKANL